MSGWGWEREWRRYGDVEIVEVGVVAGEEGRRVEEEEGGCRDKGGAAEVSGAGHRWRRLVSIVVGVADFPAG